MLSMKKQGIVNTMHSTLFEPARIIELELGEAPLPTFLACDERTGMVYRRACCLVRLHSCPLGTVELVFSAQELTASKYLPVVWKALHVQINQHLAQDGLPTLNCLDPAALSTQENPLCCQARAQFLMHAPFVSVIVPTHERLERLEACLQSLLAVDYPQYEIIVVDDAPATSETFDLWQRLQKSAPHLYYVREERPGPAWARNSGMQIARGEFLVFADDDVVVDTDWLAEMVRPFFQFEDVACVSGLVLPLKIDTPAQLWFEEYGGFQKGFERRVYDLKEHRQEAPLYPYTAGSLGVGASMAFRAQFLRAIGGFDPALAGYGPTHGGEDLAAFFQVIIRGHKMVYAPAALLYHLHRQDYAGLRKQIYNYGIGQTAYLTRNIVHDPSLLGDFLTRIPYGFFFLLSAHSSKNTKKSPSYPSELTRTEMVGMVYGPLAYVQSRWRMYTVCRRSSSRRSSTDHVYTEGSVAR